MAAVVGGRARLPVLYAGCVAGGIAVTTLFPTRVDTLNYKAALRLTVNPADLSAVRTPTIFGDIHLDFATAVPTPGVLATVQVKPRVTDLLARPGVSIQSLEPGPLELQHAIRHAALGLAWRFAAGAIFVAMLAVGAYAAWAHARPPTSRLAAIAGGWALACLVTFASIAVGYQPERLEQFSTTGILGAVQRNADLLEGVQARAEQTTPYLKNLLALSSALQEQYRPQALARPVAARVLLLSDVHGANQYALMATIIHQEQIDAVIDSGDLVNFGRVTEADAAGIFKGIASLGVPYLFTKGNHDAQSATDSALLARLAKEPNVVLLQPKPDEYTVQSINGIRIAGFNDPRWFGDDNKNNAAKQKPAAEQFSRAMADLQAPDVLVSHEPGAVAAVDLGAGILVHGHMHKAQLDGNTIGIGTFTGGGPFSHFLPRAQGEERIGQPSTFDIAAFGYDCRLASLTRYQYRNVIEGRPAYDRVTVINGSRIEAEVPAPAHAVGDPSTDTTSEDVPRSCLPTLGLTTERVKAQSPSAP